MATSITVAKLDGRGARTACFASRLTGSKTRQAAMEPGASHLQRLTRASDDRICKADVSCLTSGNISRLKALKSEKSLFLPGKTIATGFYFLARCN
ncbi:hypothetical protein [Sandarakinorhabdus sp.]|uniref:hypothetical protein n=1 Tax=Sandarakinorhabdus sp. TaxID=1916663 RepID=UPI003341766A